MKKYLLPALLAALLLSTGVGRGVSVAPSAAAKEANPIKPKPRLIAQSATEFMIAETAVTLVFNLGEQHNVTGLTLKTKRAIINARRLAE